MAPPASVPGLAESHKSRLAWVVRAATGGALFTLSLVSVVCWEARELPSVARIRNDFRNHFSSPQTRWVSLAEVSPKLRAAVIVSEDRSFYRHHGFDYNELWASMLTDLAARRYRRGGSTITQQVAKNVFLSPEKTMIRKFREAILTCRLEHALSKDQILETYLNAANWIDETVGINSAAHLYFSKPPADLTWPESALLAGMLPDPKGLNPLASPKRAQHARQVVLLKLLADGDISREEYEEAVSTRLPGGSREISLLAIRADEAHPKR